MGKVYKNIDTNSSTTHFLYKGVGYNRIKNVNINLIKATKLCICNTGSGDIRISIYLEHVDVKETLKQYGTTEYGSESIADSLEDNRTDEIDISPYIHDSKIYYKYKRLVIPEGVSVELFTDYSFDFISEYSLMMSIASGTADVIFDYDEESMGSAQNRRTLTQY
tara:strand:+ start:965 stop:1459 length:495 start_codon:yes stop_codon:yes gene_type:complete